MCLAVCTAAFVLRQQSELLSAKKREANFLPQLVPCGAFHAENFIQEVPTMRVKITLACTECKNRNYVSKKNKKNDPDRIEMMKHCRHCNKHTLHKETK